LPIGERLTHGGERALYVSGVMAQGRLTLDARQLGPHV